MKKIFLMLTLGLMLLIGSSGCNSTTNSMLSMNSYRSVARSTGDITATLVIQSKKADQAKVIEVATKIKEFLEKTDVNMITREELLAMIEDQIKVDQLKPLAEKLLKIVPVTMDLSKGKKIMIDFCNGLINGSNQWKPEDA